MKLQAGSTIAHLDQYSDYVNSPVRTCRPRRTNRHRRGADGHGRGAGGVGAAAGEDPRPQAGYDAGTAHRQDQTRMNTIGKPERATQNRVIALFRDELGYRYLGDWTDRDGNSNIEEGLLTAYLTKCGYSPEQISRAIYKLQHRGGQPQPQPLRQQQGRLQPAALRRAGEDRGGQGHRDRPAHQLGRAGEERLRHCRGSDA